MLALQMDDYSEFDRLCANHFVYAIDHSKNASQRVRQAAEIMRGWDGRMEKNSSAASIAYWSRRNLMKVLLTPKMGDDFSNYDWGLSAPALESIITHTLPRWLPQGYSSYDEVLVAAVQKTVERAPRDLKSWHWGSQFPVEVQHPLFGSIPFLSHFSGTGSHLQSGSGSTVKQVEAAVIGTGWCGGIRSESLARSALVDKLHVCEIRPERLAEIHKLTNAATARVLAANGCEAVVPPGQACCAFT